MAYAAGNIVDFIGGFGRRKEAARVKGAMKNYLTDPEGTITAVNEINPLVANDLNTETLNRNAELAKRQQAIQDENAKRYATAVSGMAQRLSKVRDNGGNVAAAFDSLVPVFKNGLQMPDDEIIQWREKIIADPSLIDTIQAGADEYVVGSPGAGIINKRTGNLKGTVPNRPQFMQVPNASGGRDVIQVSGGESTVPGAPSADMPDWWNNFTEEERGVIERQARSRNPAPSDAVPLGNPLSPTAAPARVTNGGPRTAAPAPYRSGPTPVYSTQGKPTEEKGWRNATVEEKTAAGLDPEVPYQIGVGGTNAGKFQKIGERPASKTSEAKAGTETQSVVRALQRMRDEARGIMGDKAFNQATGVIQGALPSIFQGSKDFDNRVTGFKSNVVVDTITALKAASKTGGNPFGNMSNEEGKRLESRYGNLDQTSPETMRRSLRQAERESMHLIGQAYGIPSAAVDMLLQRPKLAKDFDVKYGKGRAAEIMGK